MKKKNNKKVEKNEELEIQETEEVEEKENKEPEVEETEIVDEVKEEKPKKEKKNLGKLKIILPVCLVLVVILLVIIAKTNIVSNLFGLDNRGPASITSVTYQGKDKYQIDSTSKFIVETENIKKDELNKYLAIEPAYNYTIETKGKNKFEITVDNIEANKVINIDFVKNEKVDNKWAFQSSNDYGISAVYPADKKKNVPVNTGIDVTFTHPGTDLEEFKKHFSIEPKVDGEFKVYGRTITFVPKKALAKETSYVVKVTKGLKREEDEIKTDYEFSFTTVGKSEEDEFASAFTSITIDNISTFKSTDKPKIAISAWYSDEEDIDGNVYQLIKRVSVEKFKGSDDFYKYISGTKSIKRESLGDYKFHKYNVTTIEFDKSLSEGYYLFNAYSKKNSLMFTIPVQVNDLSAYAMHTERDALVWVAKGGKLAKGIEVSYEGKKEKTNGDGVAILRNISDGSYNIKYLKINSDSKYPIFVGVENYDLNNYPNAYVYTDRPLYKNTDTIKIWGYVPFDFFADKVDRNKFSLTLGDWESSASKNIPITVSKDGTFETELDVKNYASSYYTLTLNYNNTPIAYRYFDIENYQSQNYVYDIIPEKDFVEAGKTFKVTIKVSHISNMPAVNKTVNIMFDDKKYSGKTNAAGEVVFNLKSIIDNDCKEYNFCHSEITLLGTAQDSEDYDMSYYIPIVYNRIFIERSDSDYDFDKNLATAEIYNLDTTKKYDEDDYDYHGLKGSPYKGKVKVVINETEEVRESYYEYDEYEKEKKLYYEWGVEKEEDVFTDEIEVDGVINYQVNYEFKKSTEDKRYSYVLKFVAVDKNGYEIKELFWLGDPTGYDDELEEIYKEGVNHIQGIAYGDEPYDIYEYDIGINDDKTYSVGNKVYPYLFGIDNKKVSNSNKTLEIKYREKILDTKIKSTQDMALTYEKADVPQSNLTVAYFDGKNFYRTTNKSLKFNEKDNEIKVKIETDKKEYKPQDEVTVKIKTTDANGKGIKTNINVSVVNEAIFNTVPDYIDILSDIYQYRWFGMYTFSTYRNYALFNYEGGMGNETGDGARINFGDTIHFSSVTTDKNGEATVKFKLNDLVTSFRITVHATTGDAKVGSTYSTIESTLPLAIESSAPLFVKSSDDLVINASAITKGNKNDKVKYTVELEGTDKKITKETLPGALIYANFGKQKVGKYNVKITATSGKNKDSVIYPVEIIETANEIRLKKESNIKELETIKPTKNPIYVEIYPSYLSKYLHYLADLRTYTKRLDTKIGYYKAQEFEKDFYNTDNVVAVENLSNYQTGSLVRPLTSASGDYILTALSLYYTDYFNIKNTAFYNNINKEDKNLRIIKSLLVLSAMKEPVLIDLNNYEAKSKEENIYKALSYCFLGDYEQAKKIYDSELTSDIEEDFRSLVAIIETFVARDKAEKTINDVYDKKDSDNYIRFAIISYIQNNQDEILENEKVEVTFGDKKEEVVINKYDVKSLVLYDNDLKDIKFNSKSDKIDIAYYYVGKVSELKDQVVNNIKISTNGNYNIGETVYLNIDISKTKVSEGNIYVYLPPNVGLSDVKVKNNDTSFYKVRENKVMVYFGAKHGNVIKIPLFVKLPGTYTFESVIMEHEGKYNISNETTLKTK